MISVIILTEGQCEETFIRNTVAPAFWNMEIYLEARCIPTSKSSKGGAISFDRFMFHARNTLRERSDTYVSTMLDLYQLDTEFPEYDAAFSDTDIYRKTAILEQALHNIVIKQTGCRSDRFIPYIQPYEFEGLLFSDVTLLSQQHPQWRSRLSTLQGIRNTFATPEHINNHYETKPSKRLEENLYPRYRKTRHGPMAAEKIGLTTIESECHHFHEWMEKLRGLMPL